MANAAARAIPPNNVINIGRLSKDGGRNMARPTDYDLSKALFICERIADGESLRTICSDEEMPGRTTVYQWLEANKEFANHYARAREEQADTLADEIIGIADESYKDFIANEDGSERVNSEAIARSRLRVDARKWVAAKLRPLRYGDKVTNVHEGGATPIKTQMVVFEGVGPDAD